MCAKLRCNQCLVTLEIHALIVSYFKLISNWVAASWTCEICYMHIDVRLSCLLWSLMLSLVAMNGIASD